jgi:hypothetical protein
MFKSGTPATSPFAASSSSGASATAGSAPRSTTRPTSNGPPTDIDDVAAYAYYADDHAVAYNRKQLQRLANALGHTRVYSRYDAHGQPRRVTGADGVVTDLR